jgi:hypothetical protein
MADRLTYEDLSRLLEILEEWGELPDGAADLLIAEVRRRRGR